MVVGSQGEMIRRISIRARLNIHAALGIDSDLFLRVLVTK
jgi:GTPase Era involved in 16S rRNA processing